MIPTPTMIGRHVALVPLAIDHVPDLVRAAVEDRSTYDFTAVPDSEQTMDAYVASPCSRSSGAIGPT
jgi:hypothetical protein